MKHRAWNTLVVLVLVFDRVLKWYVVQVSVPSAAGFFSFGYFLNPALFFLPAWGWIPWVALAVLITILGFWIWNLFRISNFEFRISRSAILPILLGGASNVFDRFAYGGVVDYVEIFGFATINMADILILTGVLLLIWRKSA